MAAEIRIKICGVRTPQDISVAAEAGAAYIGLVFVQKSPRFVTMDEAAALSLVPPAGVAKVGLFLDPDNARLDEVTTRVALDMIQLHGTESPERVKEVRDRYGLPVMKAVGIAEAADMDAVKTYSAVADQILVDAKPPKKGALPGGNGLPFDWNILAHHKYWTRPWMLSGGLTAQNVAEAIRLTGARQLDLSSGVESAPGVKSPDLIRAFCEAALADPPPLL